MAKTSTERPVENDAGSIPPGANAVDVDVQLPEEKLQEQDVVAQQADPDVPQETTGGVEPRESNPTVIRYRGIGSRRIITTADFQSIGVHGQGDVEWNRANHWKLPIGGEHGVSEEAVAMIGHDPEFSLE